jgi:hypothetical protein
VIYISFLPFFSFLSFRFSLRVCLAFFWSSLLPLSLLPLSPIFVSPCVTMPCVGLRGRHPSTNIEGSKPDRCVSPSLYSMTMGDNQALSHRPGGGKSGAG